MTQQPERGLCTKCEKNLRRKSGKTKLGFTKYSSLCESCHKTKYDTYYGSVDRRLKNNIKKNHCEQCGFVAEHKCQLDVDHIDGNKFNNNEDNLQTLCANCHRLKTVLNEDWKTY